MTIAAAKMITPMTSALLTFSLNMNTEARNVNTNSICPKARTYATWVTVNAVNQQIEATNPVKPTPMHVGQSWSVFLVGLVESS